MESLSAYARQFLEQMEKPEVEYIEGLSPAISIEQRSAGHNPRSTVGTVTEIYDYMRLLFARAGSVRCFKCGKEIQSQTVQQITDALLEYPAGARIIILSPLVSGRKGEYHDLFRRMMSEGFVKVRVDGVIYDLDDEIRIDKNKKHTVELVVDRLEISDNAGERLAESVETALAKGSGVINVLTMENKSIVSEEIYSEKFACPECGINYEEITPRMFSFNSPYGACPECGGLGTKMEMDPDLVVPDKSKSLADGAVEAWRKGGRSMMLYYYRILRSLAKTYGIDLHRPFSKLPEEQKSLLINGAPESAPLMRRRGKHVRFEGVIPNLERRFRETESPYVKEQLHKYMSVLPCPSCRGARLGRESLSVFINGKTIAEVSDMSIKSSLKFFKKLKFPAEKQEIAEEILKEILQRLTFLSDVGLDYLELTRTSSTLSGGESERVRLATQIGSGLTGVLYILDEPSIGLHQRDNKKLLKTLFRLRDLGNTVIVVEHDEETIRSADYIIDLGPGAGILGGEIAACGTLKQVEKSRKSITGKYLKGELKIEIPKKRRKPSGKSITIKGAREHNLKNIDARVPLGVFTCVTGVSGSGKSTLIDDILHRALAQRLYSSRAKPGLHDDVAGIENIDKAVVIDQSPIGRTPRSNPATYTGAFSHIRELLSRVPESRMRGYRPGRFSFNVKGGRCENCRGDGIIKIEMHFLPDVNVKCQECGGRRYNRETLEIRYRGKNIHEILEMSVLEALKFFKNIPPLKLKLETLNSVGLDYIKLGQPATTLSGGEAQRVKLSKELSRRSTGRTLYILDEPTTGLHFDDVKKLLGVLGRLADQGNSVVVIEHNLDVVKSADYLIDLGPEGGERGGRIVAEGTPEEVAGVKQSYTGRYLRKMGIG